MIIKISKKTFAEILRHLEQIEDYEKDVRNIRSKYSSLCFQRDYYSYVSTDYILDLLAIITNDVDNWIWWWVKEVDFGRDGCIYKKEGDSETYYMQTPEDLYDFLVEQNKKISPEYR